MPDFWTLEDDLACYRIVRGAHALEVYDRETFVRHLSTWQLGVGGVVVSKLPLERNFATSAAESECPTWSAIRRVIETLVIRSLTTSSRLTDSQRKFLGVRFRGIAECAPDRTWRGLKLLTDPWGQHLPLSALMHYRKFVHIPEAGTLACAMHGSDATFVVTDSLLDRFGMDSLDDWLALLQGTGLLPDGYSFTPSCAPPPAQCGAAASPGR
jgi:hypothetical protein